jgi:hypothetical protein
LEQAGSFAMCRSAAWDSKVVTSAWWVRAGQVSKTAPTGLSLATGSFVIRGKKNFLDPSQLVMGFAFLFKVDESCVARHRGERSIRGLSDALAQQPFRPAGSTKGVAADDEGDDHDDDDMVIIGTAGTGDCDDGTHDEAILNVQEVDASSELLRSGDGDTSDRHADVVPAAEDSTLNESSSSTVPVAESIGTTGVLNISALSVDSGEIEKHRTDARETLSGLGDAENARADSEPNQQRIDMDPASGQASTPFQSNSKYGLTAKYEEPDDVGGEDGGPREPKATKRRMSVKERRALKANASGAVNDRVELASSESEVGADLKPALITEVVPQGGPAKVRSSASDQTPLAPLPRGKRSKLKKIKKKYGDQDEDEREIALAVLGAKKVKEMELTEVSGPTSFVESAGVDASFLNRGGGANRSEVEAARPPRQNRRQDKKEVMRLMEEEGIEELTELEKESLDVLDMLTANPLPDDIVQYALPICAPYSALTGYRYRAKLLPGSMKRGKAYRAVLVLYLKQAEKDMRSHVQERDAMRSTPENDAIHMMLGNVRVMAPGLTEGQRGRKAGRK